MLCRIQDLRGSFAATAQTVGSAPPPPPPPPPPAPPASPPSPPPTPPSPISTPGNRRKQGPRCLPPRLPHPGEEELNLAPPHMEEEPHLLQLGGELSLLNQHPGVSHHGLPITTNP